MVYQKLKWKRFLILHCYLWDIYGPYVLTTCADLTVQCLSQDLDFLSKIGVFEFVSWTYLQKREVILNELDFG